MFRKKLLANFFKIFSLLSLQQQNDGNIVKKREL